MTRGHKSAPNMRAEVFVYDESGNCIGHAAEMNTTLTLTGPYDGLASLHITGADWTADGNFSL